MVEIVCRFEERCEVCDLDLDGGSEFIHQRSQPIFGAMFVH
jgi:hypothetical protein